MTAFGHVTDQLLRPGMVSLTKIPVRDDQVNFIGAIAQRGTQRVRAQTDPFWPHAHRGHWAQGRLRLGAQITNFGFCFILAQTGQVNQRDQNRRINGWVCWHGLHVRGNGFVNEKAILPQSEPTTSCGEPLWQNGR